MTHPLSNLDLSAVADMPTAENVAAAADKKELLGADSRDTSAGPVVPKPSSLTAVLAKPGVPTLSRQLANAMDASGVSPEHRLMFATAGLTRVSDVGNMGGTKGEFHDKALDIFDDELGTSKREKSLALVKLTALWTYCHRATDLDEALTERIRLDPHCLPEISLDDYEDMRAQYQARHPLELINEEQEPHIKFLARVQRDVKLHRVVPPYALHEVKTKPEHIEQKGGLSTTAEALVKMVHEHDWSGQILDEAAAWSRVRAFWTALDMLGLCTYDKFSVTRDDGVVIAATGGSLELLQRFLDELRKISSSEPYLRLCFICVADRAIRRFVYNTTSRERPAPTIALALHRFLKEEQHQWGEIRTEAREWAERRGRKRGRTPSPAPLPRIPGHPGSSHDYDDDRSNGRNGPGRKTRRGNDNTRGNGGGGNRGNGNPDNGGRRNQPGAADDKPDRPGAPKSKAAAKRERQRERREQEQREKDKQRQPKGSVGDVVKDRIPDKEWAKLQSLKSKACLFWNSTKGCRFQDCRRDHVCAKCGGKHKFFQAHAKE